MTSIIIVGTSKSAHLGRYGLLDIQSHCQDILEDSESESICSLLEIELYRPTDID